jgi:hypothetical protein
VKARAADPQRDYSKASAMRLRHLDAKFIGRYKSGASGTTYRTDVGIAEAQGVMFQCPKCAIGKPTGGNQHRRFVRGAHYVICWFRNPRNAQPVPDSADPKPGRWYFTGTSIDDLTFTGPGAMSVLLTGGCGWHGFVTNGNAS